MADSSKPTCKVVKGKINGRNVGARMKGVINGKVAPTGTKCKVRNTIQDDGTVVSADKTGRNKVKIRETTRKHKVIVYHKTNAVELLYDTGAEISVMSWEVAKQLKIARKQGNTITSSYAYVESSIVGVGGSQTSTTFSNVPLKLGATGEISKGKIAVYDNAIGLLGTPHIKGYKRYKLKFR